MRYDELGLPIPGSERPRRKPNGEEITPDDVKSLAKQYTAEAIEGIYEIATDPDTTPNTKLTAWVALLDRGHGKVVNELPAPTNTNTFNTQVINITEEALRAIPHDKLLELRAKAIESAT